MTKMVVGVASWMLAFPLLCWSDAGPLFGPEFTFPVSTEDSIEHLVDRMALHLIGAQPAGAKFRYSKEGNSFRSPNGWSFDVVSDPGVAEIRMNPMTVADFERYAKDIHDAVFVSAYNQGMFPELYLGGGHINVDVNYFVRKPPVLLRNFLVDRMNHSELSMGIMNYDTRNAISLSLTDKTREEMVEIIKRFDSGEMGKIDVPSELTVQALLVSLNTVMRGNTDHFFEDWTTDAEYEYGDWMAVYEAQHSRVKVNPGRISKQYEISLDDCCGNDPSHWRIELRAIRPQASMDVWTRQIRLIRDRIFFLESAFGTKPIPMKRSYGIPIGARVLDYKFDPPIPAEKAFRDFYIFVEESGHLWSDHRDYLWPKWMFRQHPNEMSDLEKFESSHWFQCRELLKKKAA